MKKFKFPIAIEKKDDECYLAICFILNVVGQGCTSEEAIQDVDECIRDLIKEDPGYAKEILGQYCFDAEVIISFPDNKIMMPSQDKLKDTDFTDVQQILSDKGFTLEKTPKGHYKVLNNENKCQATISTDHKTGKVPLYQIQILIRKALIERTDITEK